MCMPRKGANRSALGMSTSGGSVSEAHVVTWCMAAEQQHRVCGTHKQAAEDSLLSYVDDSDRAHGHCLYVALAKDKVPVGALDIETVGAPVRETVGAESAS